MREKIKAASKSAIKNIEPNVLRPEGHFEKCRSLLGNFLDASLHYTKNSPISQRCCTPLDSPTAKYCRNEQHPKSTPKNFQLWAT